MQSFLLDRERVGEQPEKKVKSGSTDFVSMNSTVQDRSSSLTDEQDSASKSGEIEEVGQDTEPTTEVSEGSDVLESRVEMSTDDGAYKVEVVSIEGVVDRVVINCPEGKRLVLQCEY
jgi:hypothetical protein